MEPKGKGGGIGGFGGEHEAKRSFGRPRYRWNNNIKNKFSIGKEGCGLD